MTPLKTTSFGLGLHKFQQFHAVVPGSLTAIDVTNPTLWTHVAAQCKMGDVIWFDADNYAFTGMLKVTYANGSDLRCKLVMFKDMDAVDFNKIEAETAPYLIKMMGQKKWCVIQRSTGDVKIQMIPTKLEAMKELDSYTRALAA